LEPVQRIPGVRPYYAVVRWTAARECALALYPRDVRVAFLGLTSGAVSETSERFGALCPDGDGVLAAQLTAGRLVRLSLRDGALESSPVPAPGPGATPALSLRVGAEALGCVWHEPDGSTRWRGPELG